jgi:hypothetical protein
MRLRLVLVLVLASASASGAPLPVWYAGHRETVAPDGLAAAELAAPVERAVAGRRLRYRAQAVRGVPVIGCGVDDTLDADGTVLATSARLCAADVAADFTVDANAASAAAQAAVTGQGQADRLIVSTPVAQYFPTDGGLVPVWLVDVATAGPWRVWRVFVAGDTGVVMQTIALSRDAHGLVFPTPKAVASGVPAVRRLPGLDASGYLTGPACSVDDVTDYLAQCPSSQLFCSPPAVKTCAARAHAHAFMYSPTGQGGFDSCTTSDRFDQVTGYYQLASIANYFVRAIGWTPGSGALAPYLPMPVLANVPLLNNAFFSPPAAAWPAYLAFSDEFDPPGINDFLRDPTIPRHEFTHAIVYDTGSGLNDVFNCAQACPGYSGALNESTADYFALASLGMRTTVVGANAGTTITIARNIVNDFRFPCDLTGEPHDDSRLWSAFVLEVRKLLGRGVDAAYFRAVAGMPHDPTLQFADALSAFMTELGTLDARHTIAIVEAATRRGIAGAFAHDQGNAPVKYGPVVMPLTPGKRLALRNRFPLPLGDAHFYYFQPPAGATRVTVDATATGTSTIPTDLRYCGTVSVTGTTFPAELNNVFVWVYDPGQPVLPFALTPLDLVDHQLASAVPAQGPTHRHLSRFLLPPSPSGVYGVSVQGSGRYRIRLSFI